MALSPSGYLIEDICRLLVGVLKKKNASHISCVVTMKTGLKNGNIYIIPK